MFVFEFNYVISSSNIISQLSNNFPSVVRLRVVYQLNYDNMFLLLYVYVV